MTTGDRIKIKRNEMKMSQRELAKRIGYADHSTITKIESGKVDLPQSKIVLFAEVLGTTVAYLMGWSESKEKENSPDKPELSEGEKALLELFNRVPEEQQQLVLQMIRAALGIQ